MVWYGIGYAGRYHRAFLSRLGQATWKVGWTFIIVGHHDQTANGPNKTGSQSLGTRRGSKEDLPDPCIDSGRRDTSLEVPPEDEQGNVFFCCSIDAQTQLFSHLHLVAQILKFADFSYFQNLNLEDKMFACCLIYSYH